MQDHKENSAPSPPVDTPAGQSPTQATAILRTGDLSVPAFCAVYSRSLNTVLMLVFSNAQMELDRAEMCAIRNVMDLSIQLQAQKEVVA